MDLTLHILACTTASDCAEHCALFVNQHCVDGHSHCAFDSVLPGGGNNFVNKKSFFIDNVFIFCLKYVSFFSFVDIELQELFDSLISF